MPDNEQLDQQFRTQVQSRHRRVHSKFTAHMKSPLGFFERMTVGLSSKKYEKPSEYFLAEEPWIFEELVYPRFRDAFLAMVDGIRDYTYDVSWFRRSFRSGRYRDYVNRIYNMLSREFHLKGYVDADIRDILTGNLPEEVAGYLKLSNSFGHGYVPEVLAYELDRNDPRLEQIVTDILHGESTFATVSVDLIRGIIMSHNERMHRKLCDLLLAARLQEGLRQAICENADYGTKEAFLAILDTVLEHDLIRFSSVKRAVGTWLGLISEDTRDLDRVSGKSLELVRKCLSDDEYRAGCLESADAMAIHIGLWSLAFDAVERALDALNHMAEDGTHHQVLTAGYFVANLSNELLEHTFARTILTRWREHYDILAVYLPLFLSNHRNIAIRFARGESYPNYGFYFTGEEEARDFCDWLLTVHGALKKKEMVFEPCIFPWHRAVLKKSDLVEKAMVIAAGLRDRERLEVLCPMVPECDALGRDLFFNLLTAGEKTPVVRKTILAGLSDKNVSTRNAAANRCRELELTKEAYLQIEDLLRLRYTDLREFIGELLLKQPEDQLEQSVRRLLASPKCEKRTAGLDLLAQYARKQEGKALLSRCRDAIAAISKPTTQEKILIDALSPQEEETALFTQEDKYIPDLSLTAFGEGALEVFAWFFPDSLLPAQVRAGTAIHPREWETQAPCAAALAVREKLKSLSDFFVTHETEHFTPMYGEELPLGTQNAGQFWVREPETGKSIVPRLDLWQQWQKESGATEQELVGMCILSMAVNPQNVPYLKQCAGYIADLFGPGFEVPVGYRYHGHINKIIQTLVEKTVSPQTLGKLAVALGLWLCRCLPQEMVLGDNGHPVAKAGETGIRMYAAYPGAELRMLMSDTRQENKPGHFIVHPQILPLLMRLRPELPEQRKYIIPLTVTIFDRAYAATARFAREKLDKTYEEPITVLFDQIYPGIHSFLNHMMLWRPNVATWILARHEGIISRRTLLYHLTRPENLTEALKLTTAVSALRPPEGTVVSAKTFSGYRAMALRRQYEEVIGKGPDYTPDQLALMELCREIAGDLVPLVLEPELRRGDSAVEYSAHITGIQCLWGVKTFVRLLCALGKESLDRSVYYYYTSKHTKKGNLSYLLSRCTPAPGDDAGKLAQLLAGTDISRKRLIEAALYCPEWIDIVGEYLNLPGFKSACYYFMAHMNERFDDQKKAVIARYTPLEEDELNLGAFDVNWFRSAYEQLGEKDFDLIYDAAKYISEGNKHTRARKFADAALGRMDVEETRRTIADKRNKDLLMAWAVIPLKDQEDLISRYLYIQQFLKESRQFGSQRSASEKKAGDAALRNLATNAGFSDTLRLTLRMETRLVEDNAELFDPTPVGEWVFRLEIDELGSADILCTKDGKLLKSVPAKARKEPHVLRLVEMKKVLTDQYRRTRRMFEQAMEEETVFRLDELRELYHNRVVAPILSKLVFRGGEQLGLFDGVNLVSLDGEVLESAPETGLTVAHPVHLFASGRWRCFQQYLFDNHITQPFRQVFRELYVKTPDELGQTRSLRYAGNQIQPKQAAACLKGRRWVTDPEMGLQRVFYRENIVATIFALADWFSPADIEAPTLEYVTFCHRKTGQMMKIDEIPDVIFSEVMRDVDLAVSVAHAGGVDPETSHSTVEMRKALAAFTLPLLKLENVTLKDRHAIIDGSLGQYSVHLGSGVVHQIGGSMIHVLPVHSQHRGRIFLPFADDDPKTAEILSKIILFSEDRKLKDPTILSQISR